MEYNYSSEALALEAQNRCCAFPTTRLATLIATQFALGMSVLPAPAAAKDYFNPHALSIDVLGQHTVDLEHFSTQGGQMPGVYRVDIYLNETRYTTCDVNFVVTEEGLQPELTPHQLQDMGVNLEAFAQLRQLPSAQAISALSDFIPHAGSRFDFNAQRLDISIPQAALNSTARGHVDPGSWDQGLTAGLLNYSFSGAQRWRDSRPGTEGSHYLGLRSGINVDAWRLRNYSTYSQSAGSGNWDHVHTYAQRDIQPLKGQLTLGDSSTPGDVFMSVQYRGAQLASDENMFPDSLRGFAPVVRGIAQSNAQVTVRQNGYIIYQTYVPAGAFTITDLYPTSSSGDLEVTITEADGTERRSLQPFSAVPIMLREGRLKYAVSAGKYRSSASHGSTPTFAQGTLIYGMPYAFTLYGGLLASSDYSAMSVGVGHGFGDWGSLSTDVTLAKATLRDDSQHKGESYRFQYAKNIAASGTTFTLAGYRYSTRGYYDFQEANEIDPGNFNDWRQLYNKRSKAQVNISQSLGGHGNFYVNGYQQNFWRRRGYERSLSAGYNVSYNGIHFNMDYTYSQRPLHQGRNSKDQQLSLSVQLPLEKILPDSWARYNLSTRNKDDTTHTVSVSGTALEDNNLSYTVQQRQASQGGAASASASYKGTYGEIRAGYNYDDSSQQLNYGARGGIVAHPHGVTFSQEQGDTVALVRAPGVSGAKVQGPTGVRTDWRGYTVVPYISTYRKNRIALDTQTLPEGADIDTNTRTVIPTSGAVVLANFKTRVGRRALFTLSFQDKPVPFGASASLLQEDESTENNGIVGADGQLYLSGLPEKGQLHVKWGDEASRQCWVDFSLPVESTHSSVTVVQATCKQSNKGTAG